MKLPKGPWPDVPEKRRKTMAAIRGRNTKPELLVRRLLHSMGYRFRVNERRFDFRPDILFSARRKAIFVHGCLWHGHEHGGIDRTPRTRSEFWRAKIAANKARDIRALDAFADHGWTSLVIWECELSDRSILEVRLSEFLGPSRWSAST